MWKYVVQAQIVPSLRDTVVVARESSPFVEKGPSGIGSKDEKSETIDNSVVPFLRKTTKDWDITFYLFLNPECASRYRGITSGERVFIVFQ